MPDYDKADHLIKGKNSGCDYVNTPCWVGTGEFCDTNDFGCDLFGDHKAACIRHPVDGFYEGCKVFHPFKKTFGDCLSQKSDFSRYGISGYDEQIKQDFKEKRGVNSKCFQVHNATIYW